MQAGYLPQGLSAFQARFIYWLVENVVFGGYETRPVVPSSASCKLYNMDRIIKCFIYLFLLLSISCTYNSPYFEVIDECLVVKRKIWFQSIHISTTNPRNYYQITRNLDYDGVHKICLTDIPKGYWLTSLHDTLANNSIQFIEGQKIKISNSGGCTGSWEEECIMKNGNLILLNQIDNQNKKNEAKVVNR